MSNKFRNSKNNNIPKKILPPDAVRITKEDKTRVWLIGGREFDSKADYFQYLVDKALMAKAEVKSTVSDEEPVSVYPTDIKTEGSTDGFTGVDLREHSPTGD